jgi:hypothetical protein
MKPLARLSGVVLLAALAGACNQDGKLTPPPSVVTFQLRNDGSSNVILYQNCIVAFTIASVDDPARTIARQTTCGCDCTMAACPVCASGPCFPGPFEVPVGGVVTEPWLAVNVTFEPRAQGTCERKHTLPAGQYRIDVPVYTSLDPEEAEISRTASQTFELVERMNTVVSVALGVSP